MTNRPTSRWLTTDWWYSHPNRQGLKESHHQWPSVEGAFYLYRNNLPGHLILHRFVSDVFGDIFFRLVIDNALLKYSIKILPDNTAYIYDTIAELCKKCCWTISLIKATVIHSHRWVFVVIILSICNTSKGVLLAQKGHIDIVLGYGFRYSGASSTIWKVFRF